MKIKKNLSTIDAIILSDYILLRYGPMSHLKLQKLLFYCDAYHLAYFNKPLVNDEFEAWVHGPVLRRVYDELKDKSKLYAELSFDKDVREIEVQFSILTQSQQDLIADVLSNLAEWSEFQLEAATHRDKPWMEARIGYAPGDKCNIHISKETTRDFYKSEINASN